MNNHKTDPAIQAVIPTKLLSRADIHDGTIQNHIEHISREFRDGFNFLKEYPRSVTIFGSSVVAPASPEYRAAEELAARIIRELQYAVITGGGPGIMEAANKGAAEAGGPSVGLHISLPHEHMINGYGSSMKFSYFFARKTMLTFAAEAYIFFPGGYGTCDELFSILTLIQTGKIPRVPVLLYGAQYWDAFDSFIKNTMLETFHTISKGDTDLYEICDSADHIIEHIKKAPVSEWWKNIN